MFLYLAGKGISSGFSWVSVAVSEEVLFSKSGDKSEKAGGVMDSCDSDFLLSNAFISLSSVSSNDEVSLSGSSKFLIPVKADFLPVWV